jgi:hypothetical protein
MRIGNYHVIFMLFLLPILATVITGYEFVPTGLAQGSITKSSQLDKGNTSENM